MTISRTLVYTVTFEVEKEVLYPCQQIPNQRGISFHFILLSLLLYAILSLQEWVDSNGR